MLVYCVDYAVLLPAPYLKFLPQDTSDSFYVNEMVVRIVMYAYYYHCLLFRKKYGHFNFWPVLILLLSYGHVM